MRREEEEEERDKRRRNERGGEEDIPSRGKFAKLSVDLLSGVSFKTEIGEFYSPACFGIAEKEGEMHADTQRGKYNRKEGENPSLLLFSLFAKCVSAYPLLPPPPPPYPLLFPAASLVFTIPMPRSEKCTRERRGSKGEQERQAEFFSLFLIPFTVFMRPSGRHQRIFFNLFRRCLVASGDKIPSWSDQVSLTGENHNWSGKKLTRIKHLAYFVSYLSTYMCTKIFFPRQLLF